MKKLLFLLLIIPVCFACNKDDKEEMLEACEINNTGELKLENASAYEVQIIIDDDSAAAFMLDPNESVVKTLEAGTRFVDVEFIGVTSLGYGTSITVCEQNTLKIEI